MGSGVTRQGSWRLPGLVALVIAALLLAGWWVDDGAPGGAGTVSPGEEAAAAPPAQAPAELASGAPGSHAERLNTAGSVGRLVPYTRPAAVRSLFERSVALAADGRSVSGRVLDDSGRPVAGAAVSLYENFLEEDGREGPQVEVLASGESDGQGRFELRPATHAAGATWLSTQFADWRVSVSAAGHPSWHGRVVAQGASRDVSLPAGQRLQLVLALDDGTPLAGAVVSSHAEHLSGDVRRSELMDTHGRLGTTDASGSLWLELAADHLRQDVHIEHPDHRSVQTLELPAEGSRLALSLPWHRGIEVSQVGDRQAWIDRGLLPPTLTLQHTRGPARGQRDFATGRFAHDSRREGFVTAFDHLSDEPLQLLQGRDELVVAGPLVPAPGRLLLSVALPPPPPAQPGARWGFFLRVVDQDGQSLAAPDAVPWGMTPRLMLRDGRGVSFPVLGSWLGDDGGDAHVSVTLQPPVSLFFEGCPHGPRVDGIEPGDGVQLVVDAADLAPCTGTLVLDASGLEADVAARARLRVSVWSPSEGRSLSASGRQVAGLPPGEVSYSVNGSGAPWDSTPVSVAPGETVSVRPVTPPRPVSEPLPSPGVVTGTLRFADDPWASAVWVRFTPLDEPGPDGGAPPGSGESWARTSQDTFHAALRPGRYVVSVRVARPVTPGLLSARGETVRDVHARLLEDAPIADPPMLEVRGGEQQMLDLRCQLRPTGVVSLDVLADGAPLDADDEAAGEPSWIGWSAQGLADDWRLSGIARFAELPLALHLPTGPARLTAWLMTPLAGEAAHRVVPVSLPSVGVTLQVPPGQDASGADQALALTLDLPSGRAAESPPR